jgi:MYND finger
MATDSMPVEPRKFHKCGEQEDDEIRCGRRKATFYCSRGCQSADWNDHWPSCKYKSYLLKIHLYPGVIKGPVVIGCFLLPGDGDACTFS